MAAGWQTSRRLDRSHSPSLHRARAPEARRHARGSSRRTCHPEPSVRSRSPRYAQKLGRQDSRNAESFRCQAAHGAARSFRGGRSRPSHRLRQYRQPATRAQRRSSERNRAPHRSRRKPLAPHRPVAHRKRPPLPSRRHRRSASRRGRPRRARQARPCRSRSRERTSLNAWVLAFTIAICFLSGIVCGLIPAIQTIRQDLHTVLKEGGRASAARSGNRLRSILIVSQVALALIPLVGAGLLLRSFERLLSVNPGFRPDHILTMEVEQPSTPAEVLNKLSNDEQIALAQKQSSEFEQMAQRIRNLPGSRPWEASTLSLSPARSVPPPVFSSKASPCPKPARGRWRKFAPQASAIST